ncbi:MAG: OmpA family protein, partial [Bacillota bacterium]|nr:OmpA family protein [Bacillota bacterium]
MGRRKKMSADNGVHNEWLATFSDTVTLLLTFFILLYSFSMVDAKKFKSVSIALQTVLSGRGGISVLDYNNSNGDVPAVGETNSDTESLLDERLKAQQIENQALFTKLKKEVASAGLNANVKVFTETKGVVLEFSDNVLFDSGKAEIKGNSLIILDKVSNIIKDIPNEIVVEGHTDNVPVKNPEYKSNWELSCFRAVNVLKYFVEVRKINPARLSAVGYGEYKPIVKNDSELNKAKNRRVNVMVLFKVTGCRWL